MAVGIIAEFNPFHNGHKYLIEQAKLLSGCDAAVAVMSGSWVQRGGIAVTDKWTRARQALLNGIDLVLELPVVYSMNTAQKFAYGAVNILNAAGIIDTLAFGSESGDSKKIEKAAELITNEPPEVSETIKRLCSSGMTFASARANAYENIIPDGLLYSPNDILAIEYVSEIKKSGSNLDICAVKRKGSAHDSSEISDNIASASEIRRMLKDNREASDYLPSPDFPIYCESILDTAVIAKLRSCTTEYLKNINDVSEGLENRFIKAAMECDTVDDLCMTVKSKRYTLSRIRRITWSSLIGITKDIASMPPSYIRVLGMNEKGKVLLKQMKKNAVLPIITKPADYAGDEIFTINKIAEDIFALSAPSAELRKGALDIRTSPVII